jgi:hypothetical protein
MWSTIFTFSRKVQNQDRHQNQKQRKVQNQCAQGEISGFEELWYQRCIRIGLCLALVRG